MGNVPGRRPAIVVSVTLRETCAASEAMAGVTALMLVNPAVVAMSSSRAPMEFRSRRFGAFGTVESCRFRSWNQLVCDPVKAVARDPCHE